MGTSELSRKPKEMPGEGEFTCHGLVSRRGGGIDTLWKPGYAGWATWLGCRLSRPWNRLRLESRKSLFISLKNLPSISQANVCFVLVKLSPENECIKQAGEKTPSFWLLITYNRREKKFNVKLQVSRWSPFVLNCTKACHTSGCQILLDNFKRTSLVSKQWSLKTIIQTVASLQKHCCQWKLLTRLRDLCVFFPNFPRYSASLGSSGGSLIVGNLEWTSSCNW